MCSDGQGPDAAGSTTCAGNIETLHVLLNKVPFTESGHLRAFSQLAFNNKITDDTHSALP